MGCLIWQQQSKQRGHATQAHLQVLRCQGKGWQMTRPFMKHQREGRTFLSRHRGQAGIFWAPGTGKTLLGVRTARLPCLVICRRDDYMTWRDELLQEGTPETRMHFFDGVPRSRKDLPDIHAEGIDWVFVTYDTVKPLKIPKRDRITNKVLHHEDTGKKVMVLNRLIYEWIRRIWWAQVIADECHSIKHHKSKRTQFVIKATRHIPRRVGLSGTPITNDLSDVFSQALFVDDGKTFGKKAYWFKIKYYIQSGPGWYPRQGAKAEITERMKRFSMHVHEDDVLKLPPIRTLTKAVQLNPKQQAAYDQVLNNWELQLEDNSYLEINQVIVQLEKLRQIAGGFYYAQPDPNKPRKTVWLGSSKLDLLEDLLKDPAYLKRKPKIVIWANRTEEIERLAGLTNQFGRTVMFYGQQSSGINNRARQLFAKDKGTRFFVGQVDKGVGINELIVSDVAVYYSNSLRVVSRQQSMRRNRRKGSEIHKSITYYDLVSENTVDVKILASVRKNMDVAQSILNDLKAGNSLRSILE